jgi:hypothetical protein
MRWNERERVEFAEQLCKIIVERVAPASLSQTAIVDRNCYSFFFFF